MSKETIESITLKLPASMRRWLRVTAAQHDVSLSELVRTFVEMSRENGAAFKARLRAAEPRKRGAR